MSIALAHAVSVLIEWPLVQVRMARPVLRAVAAANLVSYALLLPFFLWLPTNNSGEWRLAPRGEHPHVDGYRLAFEVPGGGAAAMGLGEFSSTAPSREQPIGGIGVVRELERPEPEWVMGSYGFGYTYFHRADRQESAWLMFEASYTDASPHRMASVGGRYLACNLGPYVAMSDPEIKTIYRVAEGRKLRVFISSMKAASPASRPAPASRATTVPTAR